MVPGSNLLALALGIIGTQTVEWSPFLGQTTTPSGLAVDTWGEAAALTGSLQPVDSRTLQQLGLDWTRNYVTFYSPADVGEVGRDRTGDKLAWNGRTFQVVGKANWFGQDGWSAVICVEVL